MSDLVSHHRVQRSETSARPVPQRKRAPVTQRWTVSCAHGAHDQVLKAGLARIAELDSLGEDGLDWIFASPGWTIT
jgi:hypothetical protein